MTSEANRSGIGLRAGLLACEVTPAGCGIAYGAPQISDQPEGMTVQVLSTFLDRADLQSVAVLPGDAVFVDTTYDLDRALASYESQINVTALGRTDGQQALPGSKTETAPRPAGRTARAVCGPERTGGQQGQPDRRLDRPRRHIGPRGRVRASTSTPINARVPTRPVATNASIQAV